MRRRVAAPEGWVARAGICSAAGGKGPIRSGMALRKWGAKTLVMGADGRSKGSDSEEGRERTQEEEEREEREREGESAGGGRRIFCERQKEWHIATHRDSDHVTSVWW